MQRLWSWILGPIPWPKVLVPWRATYPRAHGPGLFEPPIYLATGYGIPISRSLLADCGIIPGHKRWPSMDEIIARDLHIAFQAFRKED